MALILLNEYGITPSMKRRFINFLTALSLTLLVAVVVLWVLSYRAGDVWIVRCRDVSKNRPDNNSHDMWCAQ